MTTAQSAQKAAYLSFVGIVQTYDATARLVPKFFKYFETLKALLIQADVANAASLQSTSGTTEDKLQVKAELMEKMTHLTNIALLFAKESKNNVLITRFKGFPTVVGKTRQDGIAPLCQDILDKMTPILPDLADFGISSDMLQAAQTLANRFDEKVPETREQTKARAFNTKERNRLFDEMTDLVDNKILTIVDTFKETNKDFYNRVVATITVPDIQPKPTLLRIKFKNTTGRRTEHSLTARLEGSTVAHKPNEKGEIVIKLPKGGLHNIEIPMEGGEPIRLMNLRAKQGKTTTVVVEI